MLSSPSVAAGRTALNHSEFVEFKKQTKAFGIGNSHRTFDAS